MTTHAYHSARKTHSTSMVSRRKRLLSTLGAALAVALGLTACGGPNADNGNGAGDSVELTVATAAVPGTPNAAVQDWYLDRVEEDSEGRISFERTEAESLCEAAEIVECLRDGRADVGVTIPDYTPQHFPTVSVSGIPFAGQNSQAITQTLYDIHTENQTAIDMLDQQNLHYISTWPVGRFLFGSHEPVDSIDDISGLRVRASGPVIQQTLEDAGANISAIPAAETYEAVERSMVDAVGGAMDFAVNYRLMEVLPYWTDPGIGQYSTYGMWFSKDTYDELDDDLKQIVDDATEELNTGAGVDAFNEAAQAQCDDLTAADTVTDVYAWDEKDSAEWQEQVSDNVRQTWIDVASEYGLEDPEAILAEYEAGLEEHGDAEYDDATLDCVANF